ncbi:MAG TPA: NAD-dependent epimerase/dehydratase family protein [Bryobacteraceae bacterium]|nr:NAD-dependent epimerase/dehydratase family protein [Bryobacteraceae bacterium]
MDVLVIGGTGFIGQFLVRQLAAMGRSVCVFHRGKSRPDLPAEHIFGDWRDLPKLKPRADIVVNLILASGAQAREFMAVFRGRARRVVAASSADVYRACGILHRLEEGPPDPVPLTEESPLRSKPQTYPREQIELIKKMVPWWDDAYDKIPVEQAILGDPELPGTVLRLPMIYGPGDYARRFHPVLKRIDDNRRVILYEQGWAAWRAPRGYVENVVAALALTVVNDLSAGRIYNVAESPAYSELEWARKIAVATGWTGEFMVLPEERTPAHLKPPGNTAQHWELDSTRIRRELGYREIVPLDEAIRRTIEWERANPPGEANPHPFDYAAEDAAIASGASRAEPR